MTWLSDLLPPGLDSARPSASAARVGMTYYATDTQRLYRCVSSTAWTVVRAGSDKATMGSWSDIAYYNGAHTTGPLGASGFAWAGTIYVESQPGTNGGNGTVIWCNADGTPTVGWYIGSSKTAANTMRIGLAGLTPATVELPGCSLTVGVHSFAICLKAGSGSVHYSWDGAIQTAVTITSGTYVPSTSGGQHYIGRWAAASQSAGWASIAWLQAFNADLSDADLNTLSGSASSYIPPAISTAPVFNWQGRWWMDGQVVTPAVGAQAGRLIGSTPTNIVKTLR